MKPGYRPVSNSGEDTLPFLAEHRALMGLIQDWCERVGAGPSRRVTRRELERDLGYSRTGIRLVERAGLLKAESNGGARPTYDFSEALVVRAVFYAVATAHKVRVVRKYGDFVDVLKDSGRRTMEELVGLSRKARSRKAVASGSPAALESKTAPATQEIVTANE